MKTKNLILAGLALLFSAVFASAETIKLKLAEIQNVAQAIVVLDNGTQKIVKQAEGQPDKVVNVPYELAGSARLSLARNLREFQAQLQDSAKVRTSYIKEIWGDKVLPDDSKDTPEAQAFKATPEYAKFQKKAGELENEPVEVKVTKIKPEDLRLDSNQIPVTVLLLLGPILNEK